VLHEIIDLGLDYPSGRGIICLNLVKSKSLFWFIDQSAGKELQASVTLEF
jgi:hypothetical protein